METFVNFTSSQTDAANFNQNLQNGATLNHAGIALSRQGDHAGAARVHRQALEHKLTTLGPGHISTAVSYNALGEALTHLGELDEAEENIKKALQIAINVSSRSDEGFYHENLAMVYETKGDLVKAGETRHMNAPDKYVCSYYKASRLLSVLYICLIILAYSVSHSYYGKLTRYRSAPLARYA